MAVVQPRATLLAGSRSYALTLPPSAVGKRLLVKMTLYQKLGASLLGEQFELEVRSGDLVARSVYRGSPAIVPVDPLASEPASDIIWRSTVGLTLPSRSVEIRYVASAEAEIGIDQVTA